MSSPAVVATEESASNLTLSCRGLSKTFREGPQELNVLKGIDLDVLAGETVAIVGASGAGKSTLLHCLGGLDEPDSGSVEVQGQDLWALSNRRRGQLRNRTLGFIYQFHHLLPEFTALENVCMPLLIGGKRPIEAAETARPLLQQVGLGERLEHMPGELSGGERQRAAVARAMVAKPVCILGDEPTGNLDEKRAAQVFEEMLELNRATGTSLIIVTHDLRLAAKMDRRYELHGGSLRAMG